MLPEYKLSESESRWINRKDFLYNEQTIRYKTTNKTAIVCLFYKSIDNICILADYIAHEEKKEEFDLIIVNNSKEICIDFSESLSIDNVIVLNAIANLGTDGGYSFGLEYAIEKSYDYVFLVEDDVIFLDTQAFSSVYKQMSRKTIGFIDAPVNWPQSHSCSYQFACYSIDFLNQVGTINPKLFTRGGEGDWETRIETTIQKYGYSKIIVNKKHFHPYLKKNNWSSRRIYFSRRNIFWNIRKTNAFTVLQAIGLFMYIRGGYTKLLIHGFNGDLVALCLAFKDFIIAKQTLDLSLKRMKQLYPYKINYTLYEIDLIEKVDKLNQHTNGFFIVGNPNTEGLGLSGFIKGDIEHLHLSTKIKAFFNKGIIVPNINAPLYPIAILAKSIISINEFDIKQNIVHLSMYNVTVKFKFIRVLLALLVCFPTFIVAMSIIIVKLIRYKILQYTMTYYEQKNSNNNTL